MPRTAEELRKKRPYPRLLSDDEKKALLQKAENLWEALQQNNLGGFSGINRPFFILNEFKDIIEEYGGRDIGLQWSYNDLKRAVPTPPKKES